MQFIVRTLPVGNTVESIMLTSGVVSRNTSDVEIKAVFVKNTLKGKNGPCPYLSMRI
jgi:hypothetical protein